MKLNLIVFFITLSFFVGSWQLLFSTNPESKESEIIALLSSDYDYLMDNITLEHLTPANYLEYQLKADTLRHHANSDIADLINPHLKLNGSATTWQISGSRGEILNSSHETRILELYNSIQANSQSDKEEKDSFQITTDALSVIFNKNILQTDQIVNVTSRSLEMRSDGVKVNLVNSTLSLEAGEGQLQHRSYTEDTQ
jgi:LPS export ABC transporter protein LptC